MHHVTNISWSDTIYASWDNVTNILWDVVTNGAMQQMHHKTNVSWDVTNGTMHHGSICLISRGN